ncbi:MAG: NADH-quinone oxidoreductase subunit NuoE [Pseudomonadota bacterium]
MTELKFTPDRQTKLETLFSRYEIKASALLPVLRMAQEQWGYLTPEIMDYVAGLLDLCPRHVREVASFYVMLKKQDMGDHCLQVCGNLTCCMMGSDALLKVIEEELGIKKSMELSSDKRFSLMPVQCLGSCDTAPVVQINEDYYEKLTPEIFREIIRKLKNGEQVQPGRQT